MTKQKKHPLDEIDQDAGIEKEIGIAGVATEIPRSIRSSRVWLAMSVSVFVLYQFCLPRALADNVRLPIGSGPRASTRLNLPVIRAEADISVGSCVRRAGEVIQPPPIVAGTSGTVPLEPIIARFPRRIAAVNLAPSNTSRGLVLTFGHGPNPYSRRHFT